MNDAQEQAAQHTDMALVKDAEAQRQLDGLIGVLSGLGYGGNDAGGSTMMVRSRPIGAPECWAYYIWDPLARGEIDRIWDDGIKAPWDLTGEDRKYDWRSVESRFAKLRVVGKGGLAGKYGDLLGAAFVIPDLDDGLPSHMPLDLKAIKRVRGLHVVTCERMVPSSFDERLGSDATATPTMYQLMMPLRGSGAGPKAQHRRGDGRIHASRMWRFSSEELPPIENFGGNGYPPSKLSRFKLALDAYNTANLYTLNAMNTVSVMCMRIEGLRQMACTPEGQAKVREVLRGLRWAIDNLRVLPLDKDNEEYVEVKRTVEGFAKMADVAKGWVLASSQRPKLILWGEQPAGLNADSRGEVRAWYDQCEVHRRDKFEPYLDWMLTLEFAARENRGEKVPTVWTYKWKPLMSPAPDQIASQAQQWSAAIAPLVERGIITAEEGRQTLIDNGVIATPIEEEESEADDVPDDATSASVQDEALSGIQISSMLTIGGQLASGLINLEYAKFVMAKSFPTIPRDEIDRVLTSMAGFTPATPGAVPGASPGGPPTPGPAEAAAPETDAEEPEEHETDLAWESAAIDPGDLAEARTIADMFGVPTRRITDLHRAGKIRGWNMMGGKPRYSVREVKGLILSANEQSE